MAGGMTLSTKNGAAVRNGLRAYGQAALTRAKGVAKDTLDRQFNLTAALCPFDNSDAGKPDEFHMLDQLRGELTNGGFGYEIGFEENDFRSAGQDFYAVYVIFGTRKQPANDFLFSPHEQERARYRLALREALRPSRGAQPPRRG